MQARNRQVFKGLLAAMLVSAAGPATAGTFASVALSGGTQQSLYNPATGTYNSTGDSTNGELRQEQSDPENLDVSASIVDLRVAGLATNSSTGSATASIAGLRMSALVSGGATAQNFFDSAFAAGNVSVNASVYDQFVLLVPGLAPGALLDLTASIYTDATTLNIGTASPAGSFDTQVAWRSTFYLELLSTGASAFSLMDQSCRFGTSVEWICSGSGPATGEMKLLVPNGSALALQIAGRAEAYGTAGAQGPAGSASVDAGADLGSTIAWAGITNLKDANGNVITDFSALSATSGFDYRQGYVAVVPLPPSVGLLATAVAGLAAWRHRRRRALG